MPRRASFPLLLLALALVGCIEGEEVSFPDGSDEVERLRVNAYATPEGALVETTGVGADGSYHAFRGRLTIVLERQMEGDAAPTYAAVREWTVDVEEDDFASPTIPMHRHAVPSSELGEAGTFRVRVAARVGDRELGGEPALFAHPAA